MKNVERAIGALALGAMLVGAGVRAFASGDIVLYATDFNTIRGNWTTIATSTGAGGQILSSVDRGWSTTSAPLPAPADYVETTFSAPSYTPYHLWIRLRATNDSKYNDSVWVQFSDAVDLNQNAVYPIGSTRGLGVNLENCSGCGESGWGWQDKSYWLQQPNVIEFTSTTTHTIRIQTREDGVQIDQVVLSPATYLGTSPGSVTNDTRILAKSPAPVVASPAFAPAAGSSPYSGSPAAIPGLIQSEQFDNGGEGISYHDTTTGNNGGAFRQTDVDIETSASGYDVGWVAAGEWLVYTVNVATSGNYMAEFRVASSGQGGAFHLEMNGVDVTGSLTVPNTGGWQSWRTLTTTVSLAAGTQTARLVMDTAGSAAVGNFDWMQFTSTSTPRPIVATASSSTTTPGAPAAPSSPNAPDGTIGVTVTPNLSWKAAAATSYEVRLGTANPPPTAVSNTTDFWYGPPTLNSGTKYYWQIVAKNSSGSAAGPVWSFVTAGGAATSAPAPSASSTPTSTSAAGVAVATWNIQVDDSSAAHARTAIDYLAALSPQPQIIVIEEGHQSQYATYLSELQNRTGVTWSGVFQTHCPLGGWNGSSCGVAEDEGVGVFTSLPVLGSSTTYLPFADNYHSARAVVRVAINVGGRTVQVIGAHMPGLIAPRYSSMVALKNWASGFSTPQLVAGDFNADPDQIDIATAMGSAFVDSWSLVGSGRGFTCRTPWPTMKLDYWFADATGSAQPLWSNVVASAGTVSDHFPVSAYFTLK